MYGMEKASESFMEMAIRLGFTESEAKKAFTIAYKKQMECFDRSLNWAKPHWPKRGRPKDLSLPFWAVHITLLLLMPTWTFPKNIPPADIQLFPYDILPFADKSIYPNMYWYYGQQDMKAGVLLKK